MSATNEAQLDSRYPVCVVAVGACSPLGLTAPATAAAVRAGLSAVGEHPFMVDKAGEPMKAARVAALEPDQWGVDRYVALLAPALDEALTPLLISHAGLALPLVLGLPEARPGFPREFTAELAARLSKPGAFVVRPSPVTALPYGHAAGLMALDEAAKLVQGGRVEFALAGAVDSYLLPDTMEWLDEREQLLSAANRSGFFPGEGAGICLVTTTAAARRRKLPVFAWLAASAMSIESNRIKTDTICTGQGLTDVLRKVTANLRLPEERVDFTYCDLNGERYRNEEYVYALLRTQHALVKNQNFATPADCWGDVGAASGPLFAALAVGAARRGYATGPRVLLWAGSEGGQRAAALLHLNLAGGRP